ncbi:MAG: hypothetical protein H7288_25890, partial [Kineosporiaceae bacterium]|nr:hypothetical protein [Aeromicrobium sp.]
MPDTPIQSMFDAPAASWFTSYPGARIRTREDVALEILTNLVAAELDAAPRFTEEEAFALLGHSQGSYLTPYLAGHMLTDDLGDLGEESDFPDTLPAKLALLSPTQDWVLRMLLADHEERRRRDPLL